MTNALHNSNLTAVFATSGDNETFRVSDPASYDASLATWSKLDDLRRDGRLPQTKFFEVRTVALENDRPLVGPDVRSHDRYDKAPLNTQYARPVVEGSKGFGGESGKRKAARAAWRLHFPTFHDRSRVAKRFLTYHESETTEGQGRGGWFYYHNGQTAAQGLHDLARVAERRGMVVKGADNRWYVFALEVL